MSKVHILGAGSIGKLYASALLKTENITFITRNNKSLRWKFQPYQSDYRVDCECPSMKADELPKNSIEILLVCVKAYQVEEALPEIMHGLHSGTKIILLHNGMGVWEKVKDGLPTQCVIQGLSSHGALWNEESQTLIHTGLGRTLLGPLSNGSRKGDLSLLLTLLQKNLPTCEWRENIQKDQWEKLAVNAVINPLTGYYQFKNGSVLDSEFEPIIENISREVAEVMLAKGFEINRDDLVAAVKIVARATAENFSSTNRDMYFGRPTELTFINGYIIQEGEALGIDISENKRLLHLCQLA